jgi:hypothetical protein
VFTENLLEPLLPGLVEVGHSHLTSPTIKEVEFCPGPNAVLHNLLKENVVLRLLLPALARCSQSPAQPLLAESAEHLLPIEAVGVVDLEQAGGPGAAAHGQHVEQEQPAEHSQLLELVGNAMFSEFANSLNSDGLLIELEEEVLYEGPAGRGDHHLALPQLVSGGGSQLIGLDEMVGLH